MAFVGIIANPAASKDIRRLVAQARVIPDWEKINTVRRVLLGLQAVGIDRVVAMPDSSRLCQRAQDDAQVSLEVDLLEMSARYGENDTVKAAAAMQDMGVDCLVTLGGDGTNRAVARGSTAMPLVAISTGTNNVFPTMIEGTLAGLAAGLVAQKRIKSGHAIMVSKTVEVYIDDEFQDMALVDVALSRERFVATRAIWDLATIYEVFLTRAEPASIGLSSVGGRLESVSLADAGGLHYVLGDVNDGGEGTSGSDAGSANQCQVLAPTGPGSISKVPIARWERLEECQRIEVPRRHCTVALDGERSFTVTAEQKLELAVRRNGPPVVQVEQVLREAAEQGLFMV